MAVHEFTSETWRPGAALSWLVAGTDPRAGDLAGGLALHGGSVGWIAPETVTLPRGVQRVPAEHAAAALRAARATIVSAPTPESLPPETVAQLADAPARIWGHFGRGNTAGASRLPWLKRCVGLAFESESTVRAWRQGLPGWPVHLISAGALAEPSSVAAPAMIRAGTQAPLWSALLAAESVGDGELAIDWLGLHETDGDDRWILAHLARGTPLLCHAGSSSVRYVQWTGHGVVVPVDATPEALRVAVRGARKLGAPEIRAKISSSISARFSWRAVAAETLDRLETDLAAARDRAWAGMQATLADWPDLRRECATQWYEPAALHTPRFTRGDVLEVVTRARAKHAGARIFYVTDTEIAVRRPDVTAVARPADAAGIAGPKVFVCAFFSDEKLAAALAEVNALPDAVYLTPLVFWPTSRYFHRNDRAHEVLAAEAALPRPKFAVEDFENLIQALEMTRQLPGDYVEVGVYQGRSAHCVLQYLRHVGLRRTAWLLDVYEGFTYAEAKTSSDAFWLGTHTLTSEAAVREWMAEFPEAHVVKSNIISDPLPPDLRVVAVANIDVDLYEAVAAAIRRLAPLTVPGSILILEDQGHTPPLAGAWLAVKEFLDSPAARDFTPVHLASGQLFLIRR